MGKPISTAEMAELCGHAVAPTPGPTALGGGPAPSSIARLRDSARQRAHFGRVTLDVRRVSRLTTETLRVRPSMALFVTLVQGSACVLVDGESHVIGAGAGLLVARGRSLSIAWRAASAGLVIHLPRTGLQAAVSAHLGDARRLAKVCAEVGNGRLGWLAGAAEGLATAGARDSLVTETRLCEAIVTGVANRANPDAVFPVYRSVTQAMRHVRANLGGNCDAASLARVVGVTADTLRTGFRTCLGMGLADYVWRARLDWARARLTSRHESRSIRQLAVLAGFRDAPTFSRAYLRTFHEPPTETRSRAVRSTN